MSGWLTSTGRSSASRASRGDRPVRSRTASKAAHKRASSAGQSPTSQAYLCRRSAASCSFSSRSRSCETEGGHPSCSDYTCRSRAGQIQCTCSPGAKPKHRCVIARAGQQATAGAAQQAPAHLQVVVLEIQDLGARQVGAILNAIVHALCASVCDKRNQERLGMDDATDQERFEKACSQSMRMSER